MMRWHVCTAALWVGASAAAANGSDDRHGALGVAGDAPSPSLPFWYTGTYLYVDVGNDLQLMVTGTNGERGVNKDGAAFHSWRLDISNPYSTPGSSLPLSTNLTIQSVAFKTNGTLSMYSYWSVLDMISAAWSPAGDRVLTPAAMSCASGLVPLGRALEGIDLDWLDGGVPTPIILVGNETISTPFFTNITTSHWTSPQTCQDVWLAPYGTDGAGGGNGATVLAPVLYTRADVTATSPAVPACSVNNRTYIYAAFSSLSLYLASQTGPLFQLPGACSPNCTSAASSSSSSGDGSVPIFWLAVAAVLSAFAGGVTVWIWAQTVRRREWRGRGYAPGLSLQYSDALIDAI